MATKPKKAPRTKAPVGGKVMPLEPDDWERRNSAAIKRALQRSWSDHKAGKGEKLQPKDPYSVVANARKKSTAKKKLSA